MLIDVNRFYSPKEIITENGGMFPMSLSAVYNAISKKQIPSIKIGGRKLIPGSYLQEVANIAAQFSY